MRRSQTFRSFQDPIIHPPDTRCVERRRKGQIVKVRGGSQVLCIARARGPMYALRGGTLHQHGGVVIYRAGIESVETRSEIRLTFTKIDRRSLIVVGGLATPANRCPLQRRGSTGNPNASRLSPWSPFSWNSPSNVAETLVRHETRERSSQPGSGKVARRQLREGDPVKRFLGPCTLEVSPEFGRGCRGLGGR